MATPVPNLVPRRLVEAIREGRCVAFLGAGFSAPVAPTWFELLRRLNARVPDLETRRDIQDLLDLDTSDQPKRAESRPSAIDLEAAAELLRGCFNDQDFQEEVKTVFREYEVEKGTSVDERVRLLGSIPFKAVISTNFDEHPPGERAGVEVFSRVLGMGRPWWAGLGVARKTTVKLHGQLGEGIVLARSDYRTRLYEKAHYAHFLRTVLATYTVLFLGTSFTDAYLNEIRSEVLHWLEWEKGKTPPWFAVLSSPTGAHTRFYKECEGIEVVPYMSVDGDHSGFDEILRKLSEQTNDLAILVDRLKGRRILWYDPHPENNRFGMEAMRRVGGEGIIRQIATIEEVWNALDSSSGGSNCPYDLLLTRYGHRDRQDAEAVGILRSLHKKDIRVPVIVFASGDHIEVNRRIVQSVGAHDYVYHWEDLFRVLSEFFEKQEDRVRRLGLG